MARLGWKIDTCDVETSVIRDIGVCRSADDKNSLSGVTDCFTAPSIAAEYVD